jgi:hypothetical protein
MNETSQSVFIDARRPEGCQQGLSIDKGNFSELRNHQAWQRALSGETEGDAGPRPAWV